VNSTSSTDLSSISLGQNAFISIGMASLNLASQKTHAISKVTFNESLTEAQLCFTKDRIEYGWPSHDTSSIQLDINRITPGFSYNWIQIELSSPLEQVPEDFTKKCCKSVQKAILIFDLEKTYENTLLKSTVVAACKDYFPNLKSYSLVFSSL
jgi:hypothetical protein